MTSGKYPHIMITNGYKFAQMEIFSDGFTVKVRQNDGTIKVNDTTFKTSIKLRESNKIIPYLLIDRIEKEDSFQISNLRDPFYSDNISEGIFKDSDFIEVRTIKLRFSGIDENGNMEWIGIL